MVSIIEVKGEYKISQFQHLVMEEIELLDLKRTYSVKMRIYSPKHFESCAILHGTRKLSDLKLRLREIFQMLQENTASCHIIIRGKEK